MASLSPLRCVSEDRTLVCELRSEGLVFLEGDSEDRKVLHVEDLSALGPVRSIQFEGGANVRIDLESGACTFDLATKRLETVYRSKIGSDEIQSVGSRNGGIDLERATDSKNRNNYNGNPGSDVVDFGGQSPATGSAERRVKEKKSMADVFSKDKARQARKIINDFRGKMKEISRECNLQLKLDKLNESLNRIRAMTGGFNIDPMAEILVLKRHLTQIIEKGGLDEEKKRQLLDNLQESKRVIKRILNISDEQEERLKNIVRSIKETGIKVGQKTVQVLRDIAEVAQHAAGEKKTGKDIARDITKKISEKAQKYGEDAKETLAELQHKGGFMKGLGNKASNLAHKGEMFFKSVSEKWIQVQYLRAIIKHRVNSLKKRLKSALFTEIEGGIEDMYYVNAEQKHITRDLCPKVLVPAFLAPFLLHLSQLANWMYLMHVPVCISYIVLLGVEWNQACEMFHGVTMQGLFLCKAVFDFLYVGPTVALFYWIKCLWSQNAASEAEDQELLEQKLSFEAEGDEKDIRTKLLYRQELLQMRATRAVELLESYDQYNHSWLHHNRDFWALIANFWDFVFAVSFHHLMQFISTIYQITFLFRILAAVALFALLLIELPPLKRKLMKTARSIDEHNGFRIISFIFENILFRPSLHERKDCRIRAALRRKRQLHKRRKSIIDELENIDEELGNINETNPFLNKRRRRHQGTSLQQLSSIRMRNIEKPETNDNRNHNIHENHDLVDTKDSNVGENTVRILDPSNESKHL